jgi:hypothetical protein
MAHSAAIESRRDHALGLIVQVNALTIRAGKLALF